jgi:hypothetical protein
MKRIMILIILGLLLASPVYALQQIAGPLVISVPIGGTNSAKYGLINDENETITISLRAEGDVAKYLFFPATVDLLPNKIIYTDITAKIPADYDTSLGGNITGYVYALQEGKPGQVKINVQMKKSVTILIPGLPPKASKTVETTNPQTTIVSTTQPTGITGLFALVSANSFVIVLIILVIIVLMFIKIKGGMKK